MEAIPLQYWLIAATLLFSLGVYGVIARRNVIAVLLGIELMFAAAGINLVAFWRYKWAANLEATIFVAIIIFVAACEAAVGLAIVLGIFRTFRSVDVETLDTMQG